MVVDYESAVSTAISHLQCFRGDVSTKCHAVILDCILVKPGRAQTCPALWQQFQVPSWFWCQAKTPDMRKRPHRIRPLFSSAAVSGGLLWSEVLSPSVKGTSGGPASRQYISTCTCVMFLMCPLVVDGWSHIFIYNGETTHFRTLFQCLKGCQAKTPDMRKRPNRKRPIFQVLPWAAACCEVLSPSVAHQGTI